MGILDLKKKAKEIKARKEVEKITRLEGTKNGYKIYFKLNCDYVFKEGLTYLYRIYEYNSTSNVKELEYADTTCIETF